jgi:hypothetical protein
MWASFALVAFLASQNCTSETESQIRLMAAHKMLPLLDEESALQTELIKRMWLSQSANDGTKTTLEGTESP